MQPRKLKQRRAALLASIKKNTPTKASTVDSSANTPSKPANVKSPVHTPSKTSAVPANLNTPIKRSNQGSLGDVFISSGLSGHPSYAYVPMAQNTPLGLINQHVQMPSVGSAVSLPGQFDQQYISEHQRAYNKLKLRYKHQLALQRLQARPSFNAPRSAFSQNASAVQNPFLPFTPKRTAPPSTPYPEFVHDQAYQVEPKREDAELPKHEHITPSVEDVDHDASDLAKEDKLMSPNGLKITRQNRRLEEEGVNADNLPPARNLRVRYRDLSQEDREARRIYAQGLFEIIKDSLCELIDQFN